MMESCSQENQLFCLRNPEDFLDIVRNIPAAPSKYEESKPLTWNSRVKTALQDSKGTRYLHEVCSPSLVHSNIKSENILLDAELNPHLSDCGLASLIADADQALNHNTGSGWCLGFICLGSVP
ncbi:hypothetical protein HAX54_025570 [Datura stramonium]|uniref:non-specific serine/threonine protein kinase n=1 Tax=Datura stramonium TaxID=4076 RepID=A0ABS8S7J5_DATST|nr:hypothetical protein [Datura stramonium]